MKMQLDDARGLTTEQGSGLTIATNTAMNESVSVIGVMSNAGLVNWSSSEDLADAGAASLAVMTSFFATGGAETSSLAAGIYPGQMKILSCAAHGGNMVTTVANPAWGGSGTITFTGAGSSCMLIFLNSLWHVVGSHAVTLG